MCPHAHPYSTGCDSRGRGARQRRSCGRASVPVGWDAFWRRFGECGQGKSISSKGQAEQHHMSPNDGSGCFREETLEAGGGEAQDSLVSERF